MLLVFITCWFIVILLKIRSSLLILSCILKQINFFTGIDDKIREKMNTIKTENQDIVEWNFNTDNDSGVRYGMVAFGRSPDQKYVDCMYALYKIDFTIAPKEIDSLKKHPTSKALLSYTKTAVKKKNHTNFFRLKALEGFFREGLINEINYVGSLDDIPDLFER